MHKVILILLLFFISQGAVWAQAPYTWTFTAKKTAEKTYEIHCTVDVNAPWHTYSQFTPEGGPLPTKFSFSKIPLYTLVGAVKENGKLNTRHEEVFDID